MRALVFDENLHLSDVPLAPVPAGEVRIKTSVAGVCNTDLEICKGYMGFQGVLGHEFVGTVVECAADIPVEAQKRWLGKRVVGEINCGCGKCALCLAGDTRHCRQRTTLGIDRRPGVFAEYFNLPVANLFEVPAGVTDEQAVFTEPLAAAWNVLETAHILPNSRVMVLGDGKLGQLCAQVLHLAGCELTVVGKHRDKLAIVQGMGIATAMLADWEQSPSASMFYDVVIEATGTASGFNQAMGAVRPRGTIVLKSTVADGSPMNLSLLVINEITVAGSRCGRFGPALRSLEAGHIKVEPLISATYTLDEAVQAVQAARHNSLKVLIKCAS